MMRRLRLCCEGADIYMESEVKEETVPEKTESNQYNRGKDASVFPAKRKGVKKMICKCFVHCICGKCMKTNIKTKTNRSYSVCSCSPPHPI